MNTEQTGENIFIHTLMLMDVNKNILDNIAHVANEFVDRKDSRVNA